ncbi:hypothetical protein [Streptomyces decoyicus]
MSRIEIDVVTAEFFEAFDNRGGKAADVARIRRLFSSEGRLSRSARSSRSTPTSSSSLASGC